MTPFEDTGCGIIPITWWELPRIVVGLPSLRSRQSLVRHVGSVLLRFINKACHRSSLSLPVVIIGDKDDGQFRSFGRV